MSKETALSTFTSAVDAQQAFRERHADIFKEFDRLGMRVFDAENALRDAVAEEGVGCSNHAFEVTVTPITQTTYDEALIRAKCPEAIGTQQRPSRITIGRVRQTGL